MCDKQIYKYQNWSRLQHFFSGQACSTEATCPTALSPSLCDAKDNIQGWCGLQETVSCLLDKKDDMG